MLGAALYNRRIQLQQLYIKQQANQFTLSGEAAFPRAASGWLSPDFRGNNFCIDRSAGGRGFRVSVWRERRRLCGENYD